MLPSPVPSAVPCRFCCSSLPWCSDPRRKPIGTAAPVPMQPSWQSPRELERANHDLAEAQRRLAEASFFAQRGSSPEAARLLELSRQSFRRPRAGQSGGKPGQSRQGALRSGVGLWEPSWPFLLRGPLARPSVPQPAAGGDDLCQHHLWPCGQAAAASPTVVEQGQYRSGQLHLRRLQPQQGCPPLGPRCALHLLAAERLL